MLEQRYWRTRLIEDRRAGITQQHRYHKLYSIKQDHYWERKISDRDRNPKKRWKKISFADKTDESETKIVQGSGCGYLHEGFP